MKHTIRYVFAILVGSLIFTSCEDPFANQKIVDPTAYKQESLQDTTSFVATLKTGISPVSILKSNINDSLGIITCTSAPVLADSLAKASYKLVISDTPNFTTSHTLPFVFKGKSGADFKVSYKTLNDTVFAMNSTNGERTVYVKVSAFITKGGLRSFMKEYVMSFNVSPLPMKTYTAVNPRLWYIIGLGGNWNNSIAGLGSSLIPLDIVDGSNYNDDGDGKFTYSGYFKASDSFKILRNIGDWNNDLWGMSGAAYVHNGGDNIKVPADGYYTITLNSIANTLSIQTASITPKSYTSMGLIGAMTGWGSDVNLTANTSAGSHVWYTTYTFTSDSQCKFRAQSDWGINWGAPASSDGDPLYSKCGIGIGNGKNLIETSGTYTIIINDISGCYYFVKQ